MITAQKLAEIELPQRCNRIAVATGSREIAVSGSELAAVHVTPDLARATTVVLPLSLRDVALAPSGAVLAIVDATGISLIAPVTGERLAAVAGDFDYCAFNADGRWLCTARQAGDNAFTAELR